MVPIEESEDESDKVIYLLIHKNQYPLIEKLNVILGNVNCKYVCRNCFNSNTCQILLNKHKEKCEQSREITTNRTSDKTHLFFGKSTFIKFDYILGSTQILNLIMK